jgi:hypothetical protein
VVMWHQRGRGSGILLGERPLHHVDPVCHLDGETISPLSASSAIPDSLTSSLARGIARQHLSVVGGAASRVAHLLLYFGR